MPGLAASDNSPPAPAPPPRRLSSPLPRRAPSSPSPSASSRAARALEFAERAAMALERRGEGAELELAMSLHVAAAIHCGLGRHADAIPVLERAVAVVTPPPEAPADGEAEAEAGATGGDDHQQLQPAEPDQRGEEWSLAAFSGWMQLGDTHAMLGRMDDSIACYGKGLEIQMAALGERDPRVAETCRYLAEAHVQALQFDEAEKLCREALQIHREHSAPASLEEASDRRLMALVLDAKGDYDGALEHLVLASMTMVANGRDIEVATIDVAIGNTYLALARFDEAVFSYQKALTVLKSARGDDHPTVASVYVRLADLYHRTGRLRESKSYCENALRVYAKPAPGAAPDEIAGGLMEIAAIYEALGDLDEALKLLQRALRLLEGSPGQWSTVAGIEAQMGVLYYMVGRYADSRNSFESAVAKLRAIGERKSAFFGVLLNQMGLACVQLFKIDEAAQLFEEARAVLEQECGASHPDTLGVYSNLAAIYDAMGRVEDAIEILEHVLKVREEKLGTANPDVDDEKKRLAELLKEAGRSRNRKQKSLQNLFGTNSQRAKKEAGRRWSNFGFRS
uniref:Uncharacterized protein n=1 Tax=Zea mays TaxID=4577 RepID=A0A804PDJ3_MAIZE